MAKIRFLNGTAIKLIAALFMTIDHIGLLFFPRLLVLRSIGRISFPLFAYMLAEGCHYTKNKANHFLLVFCLGVLFQIVYGVATGDMSEYNIFLTFSLSIVGIYSLQYAKEHLFSKGKPFEKVVATVQFPAVIVCLYVLSEKFSFDYGFFGILLPLFPSLFDQRYLPENRVTKLLSSSPVKILLLAIGLYFICAISPFGKNAFYAYIAIPILLLYNGTKGKWNLKYFFYVYYPLHLVLLQGIAMLTFFLN
ncbi:MAG: hypothetical protein J6D37_07270 [Clostridia bacterium]|nr:hypothetical protein [Clostridia bacterium]